MILLSVSKLADQYNPLLHPPWKDLADQPSLSLEELQSYSNPLIQPDLYSPFQLETRGQHLNRILWLAKYGWEAPIELNFQFDWPISDGNHRVCAAIFRKDEMIEANWEGSKRKLQELL